jgi:polar amino acid transport system ATP-binding protein
MPADSVVSVKAITKRYGDQTVLRDVSLNVAQGQVHCIIGPSGSGKSTLLRCINGLEPVQAGSITVDGTRVGFTERRGRLDRWPERSAAELRARVGFVFQQFNLFPHLTALQNATAAQTIVLGRTRSLASERAQQELARVGLAGKQDMYPRSLSGGEQQRVAIARALAMDPKVILFDEVTSALDPELVDEVLTVMSELAAEGMTMIVVTHEMRFAREVGDHVLFIEKGSVVEEGRCSDVFTRPRQERTAEFLRNHLPPVDGAPAGPSELATATAGAPA